MRKMFLSCLVSLSLICLVIPNAFPKGGSSSGGGGGHSSSSSSVGRSSPSHTTAAPANPNKGGFSSQKPAQVQQHTGQAPQRSTTTTTTTTNRTVNTSSPYIRGGGSYGGMGMGYGYLNGLLTGLIIGNMMHPYGSMMYTGPGMYSNNALLYPNGQVVNQQGILVGMYQNGQFTPVNNGQFVAQQAPADAFNTPAPQPVIIQQQSDGIAIVIAITLMFTIFFVWLAIVIFLRSFK